SSELMTNVELVDDLVVIDDASSDATAATARSRGARVLAGPGRGKGEAMALAASIPADLVVFLDGDVTGFQPHFVTGLLGPILGNPLVQLVKGRYERPLAEQRAGGGRVTELVAKPALALFFPELSWLGQPLAGETAVRSCHLRTLRPAAGYAVEIAWLIDTLSSSGAESIAEVDLGVRTHRNRPLEELVPQAAAVLGTILDRAGVETRNAAPRDDAFPRGPGISL
ncbi:MAG: glucosyl-3-phosphoglycerate synthase, partial [Acidimicrobiales bacterium]